MMAPTERAFTDINYRMSDDTAVIEIDRPEVYNSLRRETINEMASGYQRANEDGAQAIRLQSVGEDAFCTGADLPAIETYIEDDSVEPFLSEFQDLVMQFVNGSVPVIGGIHGQALAGGLELVLACDIVVAAPDAAFGDQHANFDLVAGAGGTQMLPRLVGRRRAKYLILTGERIDANTAEEWGLVNDVAEDPHEAAQRVADSITDAHPVVSKRAKELIDTGLECSFEASMTLEREVAAKHLNSDVAKAGIERFKNG